MSTSDGESRGRWNAKDPTWGVLVIHGVGGAEAGSTLDALLLGLLKRKCASHDQFIPVYEMAALPEVRRVPDFQPTEHPIEAAGKAASQRVEPQMLRDKWFEMHLRRIAVHAPRDKRFKQALFGEVYWADLAKARPTVGDLMLQLFTVLFSLRYISWQAVQYPRIPGRWLWPFWYVICSLISGPLAAVYGSLLFMLIIRWVALKFASSTAPYLMPLMPDFQSAWAGGLGAVVAGLAAIAWLRRRDSGLQKTTLWDYALSLVVVVGIVEALFTLGAVELGQSHMLCLWVAQAMIAFCLLIVASAPWRIWGGIWRLPLTCVLLAAVILPIASRSLMVRNWFGPPVADPFADHLAILLAFGEQLLILLIFGTLVFLLFWANARNWAFWRRRIGATTNTTRHECHAVASAVNGAVGAHLIQIGLWSLVVPTLLELALSLYTPEEQRPFAEFVATVPLFLAGHLGLALIIVALILIVTVWRFCCAYCPWLKCRFDVARLVVNESLIIGLVVVSCLGGWQLVCNFIYHEIPLREFLEPFVPHVLILVSVLAVVSGFACRNVKLTRDALHIVMDIVGHFYKHRLSYRRESKDLRRVERFDPATCIIQQRIEFRVWRVIEEMFRMAPIQKLTVLSHSQGSQIAIDSLWYPQAYERLDYHLSLKANPERGIALVTMGSPFTHLYQHYFPFRYPPLFTIESSRMIPNEEGWPGSKLDVVVNQWLNLFRVDDYVGTCIEGRSDGLFPENQELGPGGHTGYWEQPEVIDRISPMLPGV